MSDEMARCRGLWVNTVLDRIWDRLEADGSSESLSVMARMSEDEYQLLAWREIRDPQGFSSSRPQANEVRLVSA